VTADVRQQLTEALDEVEKVARAATPGPWMSATHNGRSKGIALVGAVADRGTGKAIAVLSGVEWRHEDATHIARWDPATVLRLVERDRKLVADYDRLKSQGRLSPAGYARLDCLMDEIYRAAECWLGTPNVDDALPYDPDDDAEGLDPRDQVERPAGTSEVDR